jgi:hypothetical protein
MVAAIWSETWKSAPPIDCSLLTRQRVLGLPPENGLSARGAHSAQRLDMRMDPIGMVLTMSSARPITPRCGSQVSSERMTNRRDEFHLPIQSPERSDRKEKIRHTVVSSAHLIG